MTTDPLGDRRIWLCKALIQIRRAVGDSLGFSLCPSPIWDMLMDLYLAHHEQREVYLWPLCMAANIPLSTAHRKIGAMEKRGLLSRTNVQKDRRRIGIRLTDTGLQTVSSLLDQIDVICHSFVDR